MSVDNESSFVGCLESDFDDEIGPKDVHAEENESHE